MNNKVFESKAIARYITVSPFKVRRVVDQIRGKSFEEALMILVFLQYRSSFSVLKVVRSAAKNAQENFGISKSSLYIKNITVSGGPIMKRFRPRAQGRGFPIRKPTAHIYVTVGQRFF
jgi:ribosomal protein L22, bacterial type